MKDQFDKNLADKIRNTLREHEEPYVAGSWEKFQKKRNRSKGLFWQISLGLAATLLFAMIATPFVIEKLRDASGDTSIVLEKKPSKAKEQLESSSMQEQEVKTYSNDMQVALSEEQPSQEKIAEQKANDEIYYPERVSKGERIAAAKSGDSSLQKGVGSQKIDEQSVVFQNSAENTEEERQPLAEINTEQPQKTDLEKPSLAENEEKPLRLYKDSVMNELFTNPMLAESDEDKKKKDVKWGVMVSSGMNYNNAQTNSSLNIGGGITTEIPLTKRLDLFAGVAVARQSVLVDQNDGQNMMLLSGRQLLKSTANLLWLDVPVNIQYNIASNENNNLYVSAGLSSGTYLKEEYEQLYQVQEFAVETTMLDNGEYKQVPNATISNQTESESEDTSGGFGLARLLNLSFGVEYNFQKNMGVVLEPYFKYPLGELTSRDMKYSTGGINLRVTFSGKK